MATNSVFAIESEEVGAATFGQGWQTELAVHATPKQHQQQEIQALTDRHIDLQGATNFRDMGGYANRSGERVRWGQVFRSDHLAELVAADWAQVSELGIGLVADLRNDRERARWPSGWPDHLEVEFMMRDFEMDLRQLNEVGYHTLAYQQVELLRGFFRTLAQPDAPRVLIHCTAGQDRTGYPCALLLALLEVPRETILQDYSLSHHQRRH